MKVLLLATMWTARGWKLPSPRAAIARTTHVRMVPRFESFPERSLRVPFLRRAVLPSLFVLFGSPAFAEKQDVLVEKLSEERAVLSQSSAAIANGGYDVARRAISGVLVFLSTKGYTGVSVKSRALALGEAGQTLAEGRRVLLSKLGVLDLYLYNLQLGVGNTDLVVVQGALNDALKALDDVIEKCEMLGVPR